MTLRIFARWNSPALHNSLGKLPPRAPRFVAVHAPSTFARIHTTSPVMADDEHTPKDQCLFCKIIDKKIPSLILEETDKSLAFLDAGPLSRGHALVIPKYHGKRLTDIPDDYLTDTMVVAKKVAKAQGCRDYNILQNNGKPAHQLVFHVHFHVIPKPDAEHGLVINEWNPIGTAFPDNPDAQAVHKELKNKM